MLDFKVNIHCYVLNLSIRLSLHICPVHLHLISCTAAISILYFIVCCATSYNFPGWSKYLYFIYLFCNFYLLSSNFAWLFCLIHRFLLFEPSQQLQFYRDRLPAACPTPKLGGPSTHFSRLLRHAWATVLLQTKT